MSMQAPHRILTCELTQESLLGYNSKMLQGRSIQIFQGPKTNSEQLKADIKNTTQNFLASSNFYLYDADGVCHSVTVTCAPIFDVKGIPCSCQLFLCPAVRVNKKFDSDQYLQKNERTQPILPAKDPLPSPYIRHQTSTSLPDIVRPLPPGMKPIIWRRITHHPSL